MLGNQEMLEKRQIWLETQPSLQKIDLDKSSQKARKTRYQSPILSNFAVFPYFVPNILSWIVEHESGSFGFLHKI